MIVKANSNTVIATIKLEDFSEISISTTTDSDEVVLVWDYVNKDGTCGTNYVKQTVKGGYYMNKNLSEKKSNKE